MIFVLERGSELRDAVRQLVADDVDPSGEVHEDNAVAIAVNHLRSVPERVVELHAIVNGGVETHAAAIDGVAAEDLIVEIIRVAGVVVRLVDSDVRRRLRAFAAHEFSRQCGTVLRVISGAALHARRRGEK